MPSEFAPPPPKIRYTKAQIRKLQKQYEDAAKNAKDTKDMEELEKSVMENNLKSILDDFD